MNPSPSSQKAARTRGSGTYTPPKSVQEEARRALEWMKQGEAGQGFTSVGRRRASQLANGQQVSVETLKRMRSYFARHVNDSRGQGYKPGEPGYPSAGRVAWAAWGGDAGRAWANDVLRGLEPDTKAEKPKPSKEQALRVARMIGCSGAHQDENGTWLPCSTADELNRISTEAETKLPASMKSQDTVERDRMKGRRRRRRLRREWQNLEERPIPVGGIETLPGGGIVAAQISVKAERRKARRDRLAATPAPPRDRVIGSKKNRVGSAGSVSKGRDIVISETTRMALREKVSSHNAEVKGEESWKQTSLGALQGVYRRGAGAFSGSHRPGMTRGQWAMGRVNAFLKILKSGKPENSRYVGDNDLLPKDHPWRKQNTLQ